MSFLVMKNVKKNIWIEHHFNRLFPNYYITSFAKVKGRDLDHHLRTVLTITSIGIMPHNVYIHVIVQHIRRMCRPHSWISLSAPSVWHCVAFSLSNRRHNFSLLLSAVPLQSYWWYWINVRCLPPCCLLRERGERERERGVALFMVGGRAGGGRVCLWAIIFSHQSNPRSARHEHIIWLHTARVYENLYQYGRPARWSLFLNDTRCFDTNAAKRSPVCYILERSA